MSEQDDFSELSSRHLEDMARVASVIAAKLKEQGKKNTHIERFAAKCFALSVDLKAKETSYRTAIEAGIKDLSDALPSYEGRADIVANGLFWKAVGYKAADGREGYIDFIPLT